MQVTQVQARRDEEWKPCEPRGELSGSRGCPRSGPARAPGPEPISCHQLSLTRRVFSTSPHGSRFTKSIPVRGVPVGGSRIDASIMRYSTFMGFIWEDTVGGGGELSGRRLGLPVPLSSAFPPPQSPSGREGREAPTLGLIPVGIGLISQNLQVFALLSSMAG